LAAPLLAGALNEVRRGKAVVPPAQQAVHNSADLLAFVSPQPLHPLWGAALRRWYHARRLDLGDETVVYPGLAVVALAGLGLAYRPTRRPFWALGALGMALLALGPVLHLGGPERVVPLPLGLPTPYGLLQELPLLAVGRTPSRFMGAGLLCLAVLAARGVSALHARTGRGAPVAMLAGVLVGV